MTSSVAAKPNAIPLHFSGKTFDITPDYSQPPSALGVKSGLRTQNAKFPRVWPGIDRSMTPKRLGFVRYKGKPACPLVLLELFEGRVELGDMHDFLLLLAQHRVPGFWEHDHPLIELRRVAGQHRSVAGYTFVPAPTRLGRELVSLKPEQQVPTDTLVLVRVCAG